MKDITNHRPLLSAAAALGFCLLCCKDNEVTGTEIHPDFVVRSSGFAEGDTIFFENTTTGTDDANVQWHWSFGNGRSSAEREPYTLYDTAGSYVIELSVTAQRGAAASKKDTITIHRKENPPLHLQKPVIAFSLSLPADYYDGPAVYAGTPLKFTDRSVDDGAITLQQWTFDHAETRQGKVVEYTFEHPGEHTVTLQVTDNDGLSSDTTFSINVEGVEFTPWKPGYLDIHHINTGRGDASFFLFPDGTNMLFDAGDKDVPGSGSNPDFAIHPDGSKTPGEWIADYLTRFIPDGFPRKIDYTVVSHFHVDHLGRINNNSPRSAYGNYQLGGITQVGELIPMSKIIDRDYPTYQFPVDLSDDRDDIENYIRFLRYHQANRGMEVERIAVGISSQIVPVHSTSYDFRVTNLYAAGEFGTDGRENHQHTFSPPLVNDKGEWNDNPLSIALKIEYGPFDYYTGGDITGQESWPDYDIETPLGKRIGEVDAMAVNHHGYKDATNQNFVNALTPQVAIQQTSNTNHVNLGVVSRLKSVGADLYISNIAQIYAVSAIAREYKSLEGHVVIRVYEGGRTFDVFVLSDRVPSAPGIKKFGPYQCR
ncbi:MAG: hypothetical protein ABS46_20700 [Cytophagaceae bacterium SCN 52-12]|nr:MAG: hypothetical protein ABS46_20700 [Cytophagaceae bacterium SCN 52-12]